jgi:hypothetical protein
MADLLVCAPTSWLAHRNKLFCAGIQPRHWNDNAITLDNQILRITHLPWHFGGQRAYFLCDCGRRVGTLYRPPGHPWRCRKCYQLTYAARQAAPRQRLILKAQKVREQLGGKLGVLDVFPDKPKSMRPYASCCVRAVSRLSIRSAKAANVTTATNLPALNYANQPTLLLSWPQLSYGRCTRQFAAPCLGLDPDNIAIVGDTSGR